MLKFLMLNRVALIAAAAGLAGCMTVSGCFWNRSPAESAVSAAVGATASAAKTSSAGAVPAAAQASGGGAGAGKFLSDLGSAPAIAAVASNIKPFFLAGLGLVILGAVTIVFGGKVTGFTLIALGVATTGTGVLFIQYPWIVLIVAVVVGALVAVMAYTRNKDRKALEETTSDAASKTEEVDALKSATAFIAQAIESVTGGAEVKAAIRDMGSDAVAAVKKVVTPIKQTLAAAPSVNVATVAAATATAAPAEKAKTKAK